MNAINVLLLGIIIAIVLIPLVSALVAGIVLLIVFKSRKKRRSEKQEPAGNASVSLAESIKRHRAEKGLTQEQVAEALDVSRQAVSKWESGASEPSTANLIALAKLFGVSLEELVN